MKPAGTHLRKKGEKLAPLSDRLKKLGLQKDWDYVLHLPLRYEDETRISKIQDAAPGSTLQVQGEVASFKENFFRGARQATAVISDGTGSIRVRLLHFYPSQTKMLAPGSQVRLYGTVRDGFYGPEMVHPKLKPPVSSVSGLPSTLTPVYPAGESVTQPWLRKRIARALLDVEIRDHLSASQREELGVMELKSAINRLHNPPVGADEAALDDRTDPAWVRVKFDELTAQQIALRLSRERKENSKAIPIARVKDGLTDRFYRSLPFSLTSAQKRVVAEIARDIARGKPMNRLVQGDVGSGKTIVAALASTMAIDAGCQAAIMAPTEILAEQHWIKLKALFKPFGIEPVRLSGRMKAKEKREALEKIASGEAGIAVGTHALIQEGVVFKKLALAIVDEQHRFGVAQRLELKSKNAEFTPHLLMLSATPIPRTLAMSYLADTDVSVIDELPPGRTPVKTRLISEQRRNEVIELARRHCAGGGQLYWVCPLVEESEKMDLSAASQTFEEIRAALPGIPVGLLHGQMDSEDKNRVMTDFAAGRTAVLVATTVIEVGVDVPNATIIVIDHAERFGLSQLHQLRGRVGRGTKESWCVLLFGALSETGRERLKIIRETNDGFTVAQKDLELRGPGEFLGARQSGVPLLRFADITDQKLVAKARDFAARWIAEDPEAAQKMASRWNFGRENFLEA